MSTIHDNKPQKYGQHIIKKSLKIISRRHAIYHKDNNKWSYYKIIGVQY